MRPDRMVLPPTSITSASAGQSVDPAGRISAIRLRSMTRVPGRTAAPVPSKIRPPVSTRVPSGPCGPGGIGIRRGSSVVRAFESIHILRSCALCWPCATPETVSAPTRASCRNSAGRFLMWIVSGVGRVRFVSRTDQLHSSVAAAVLTGRSVALIDTPPRGRGKVPLPDFRR